MLLPEDLIWFLSAIYVVFSKVKLLCKLFLDIHKPVPDMLLRIYLLTDSSVNIILRA